MDDRVRQLIEADVHTVVGLDVALFFQENPNTFDTADGVALRTHRNVSEVRPAIERLADRGILERYPRGDGRYICYALDPSPETWNLLCLLSEAYLDDADSRKEIVRILILRQKESRIAMAQSRSAAGGEGQ
jgi:hypothetical protein